MNNLFEVDNLSWTGKTMRFLIGDINVIIFMIHLTL